MKPKEAIERLETIFVYGVSNNLKDKEAKKFAIQAIEKQVAKKPIITPALGAARGVFEIQCPSCNKMMGWCEKEMISKHQSYCQHCGQYLSSKEVEE